MDLETLMTQSGKAGLFQSLKSHEGLRLEPYQDSLGNWTIGYGHLLKPNEPIPERIDEATAERLLEQDVAIATDEASKFSFFQRLDPGRQDVITEMMFNLGHGRFSQFRDMIAALEGGDYNRAADEMLDSKWASQVGDRAVNLSLRMRPREVGI